MLPRFVRYTRALLWLLLLASSARAWDDTPSVRIGDYAKAPHVVLKNSSLEAWVMEADPKNGFYRRSRFETAGIVSLVRSESHDYIGRAPQGGRPEPATGMTLGLAGEFSVEIPLPAPDEAAEPRLVRIGVGLVRPARHPAGHAISALVEPFPWTSRREGDSVRFSQDYRHHSGLAYRLDKYISLSSEAPRLTVAYRLENTGDTAWKTRHYCHNFLRLDDLSLGPDLRVTFEHPIEPLIETFKKPNGARLHSHGLAFNPVEKLGAGTVYLSLLPGEVRLDQSTVHNLARGALVRVQTSYAPAQYIVYVSTREVCPEPFIDLALAPGEVREWTNAYEFTSASGS